MWSLSKKRSSWASGRGKVPSYSMGFWVARTRKGLGRGWGGAFDGDLGFLHGFEEGGLGAGVGVARLISSARRMLTKRGAFDEGEFA